METPRSRSKFMKNKSERNRVLYVKQCNYCVSFLKKLKKDYSANLNEKSVISNKPFWKTVKLALSDKVCATGRIHITEKVIKMELEATQILNNFFQTL